jgi:hypothetical protein
MTMIGIFVVALMSDGFQLLRGLDIERWDVGDAIGFRESAPARR